MGKYAMIGVMKRQKNLPTLLFCIFIGLVAVARIHLAIVRYIDTDEFAHLHWGWLLWTGQVPYRDFFINFVPLYHWFLQPVFLLPPAASSVVFARLWQFVLFAGTLSLVYLLAFGLTNNRMTSLLAIAIFSVFPMTFDKSMEIRPDMLMTLLFFAGFVLLVEEGRLSPKRAFAAGACLGLSTLTLLKIVFAAPSILFFMFARRHEPKHWLPWFLAGAILPAVLFFLYTAVTGTSVLAFRIIIEGSRALKEGEGAFSLWKTFSPWPLVYVPQGGVSLPWAVNTAIWILSLPGLFFLWRMRREAAVAFLLFLTGAIVFFYAFPTPYTQYFIPPSVLASILCALTVFWVSTRVPVPGVGGAFRWGNNRPSVFGFVVLALTLLALGTSFWYQYSPRIEPAQTNEEQMRALTDILHMSRPNETVYDMVGSYVFRPDAYYICCNIYSSFASKLPVKTPPLAQALVDRQTKFIILDRTGKAFWLPTPQDLDFILTHYVPSPYKKIYTAGVWFRCINGVCLQLSVHDQPFSTTPVSSFSVVFPETYTIDTVPSKQVVTINDRLYADGTSVFLTAGTYRFLVPLAVSSLSIRLNRRAP